MMKRLVEGHARISVEHRIAAADEAVAIFQNGGSTRDLITSFLPLNESASEGERLSAENC